MGINGVIHNFSTAVYKFVYKLCVFFYNKT